MDKILILKKYMGEGVEDALFPNAENPIEIGAFRYDAKRMGGAPTISASVNYPSCLDDEWTDNVYAEFNGEKYFLKQTPTSSYNNESTMYKHDLELISERSILDNVYFFDAVEGMGNEVSIANKLPQSNEWQLFGSIDPTKAYSKLVARYYDGSMVGVFEPVPLDTDIRIVSGPPIDLKIESDTGNIYLLDRYNYFSSLGLHLTFMSANYADKPLSNSTKVVFFGNIHEFASRMNASLAKSGVGYDIVVDEEITTEEKLMSFEDQFFSNVLQEIYNTYEVPYYFDGKTIHIGYSKGAEIPTFAYGVDDALLSITKNNANYKIVNRATATGSSDNIPFYYPNNSPKGDIAVETNREELQLNIRDYEKFSNKVGIDDTLQYEGIPLVTIERVVHKNGGVVSSGMSQNVSCGYLGFTDEYKMVISSRGNTEVILSVDSFANFSEYDGFTSSMATFQSNIRLFANGKQVYGNNGEYTIDAKEGENLVNVYIDYKFNYGSYKSTFTGDAGINYAIENIDTNYWYLDGKQVRLADLGIEIAEGCEAQHGDTITQRLVKYVKTSRNLMPSIYRETDGDERFYNAINGAYADENGEAIEFANPYVEGKPKEHIFTVENIKPSIEGMVYNGQRIDMFEAFAYDVDDNDETYEDENGNVFFKHPYFFAKLKPLGFNLFKHAIEQQPMTISFTSGNCGACNFEIAVDEDTQKNTVQVDEDGNLVYDENGMVLCGVEGSGQGIVDFQDIQQDTTDHSVWIALRKEEDTYGILMPKAPVDGAGGHRPTEEDTFVILGINLPYEYIEHAEKRLEDEIIKYLKDNNKEKFTFSIGFSRVYFAENPSVLESLSENSKVTITYNNKPYDLYVSSFSYTMSEGDSLPEIRIELDDTLKVSQNALQNAISEVKSQLGKAIGNIDVVGAASPYFVRKDIDDEVRGNINFTKGVRFGEGGKVEIQEDNSAKLSIEYLEVTKKATFTSLEIQEKTHAGGQILVTPAAINCGEVVEYDDYYRCYFQTKGADGDEIFNQFAVNDQAICQTFNAWGSQYYWRLVVGVGEDYIDLSKTDCDKDSGIPSAGDKIIQLGNREDSERQNAIVIAAYGDDSPYIIQYKGINSFELGNDNIITKLSSTENIFTGKVHMELGSDGLDSLPEWIEVRNTANEALEKAGSIGEEAFDELERYIDGVREQLQEQIDGAVDSYFEDYEPTTSNYPAKDWASVEEKNSHLNDTFTNLIDGRSWRWSRVAGTYTWVEIADTATSEALRVAGQAKASADGKIRMFVTRPTPPYSVGDLWSRGEDAPLMCCTRSKDTGTFNEDDWDLADNSQAYTDNAINNIKVGGENLLRNSGFTGDYLSERLADESVLLGAEELYSPPFDHWEINADINRVELPNDAASGYGVDLGGSFILQKLYYNISIGEQYVISFKAKNKDAQSLNLVNIEIGGESSSILVNNELKSYSVVLQTKTTDNRFILSGNVIVCDLKLEKGNKATSWSTSPLDNRSDRAYYQSMKYLSSSIVDGSTDILGGLVLTNQIKVGNYANHEMIEETGGMNGSYTDAESPFLWGGGTLQEAIATIAKHEEGTATPTGEIPFAVTHGGKVILNDAIVRGTVYATDGEFAGKIHIDTPDVNGRVSIDDDGLVYYGKKQDGSEYRRISLGGTCQGASIVALAPNANATFCTNAAVLAVGDETSDAIHARGDVLCYDGTLWVNKIGYISNPNVVITHTIEVSDNISFNKNVALHGTTAGLRTKTRVITSTGSSSNPTELSETDFSVLVNATSDTYYIKLPASPIDGQEYWIETKGANMVVTSSKSMWSHWNAVLETSHTFEDRGVIRFKYYSGANQWTYTWVESH